MPKRVGATAAATAAKKIKRDPKCEIVVSALKRGLSGTALHVLEDAARASLAVAKDQRHPFMERILDMTGAELQKVGETLGLCVGELKATEEHLATQLCALRETKDKSEADKAKAAGDFTSSKFELADVTDSYRHAQRTVTEATLNIDNYEAKKAADALAVLDEVATALEPEGGLQALAAEAAAQLLQRLQNALALDESLAIALPAALAKAPADRHNFDQMTIQATKALIAKNRERQQAVVAEDSVGRAKREEALLEAQEALRSAKAELLDHAAKFELAKEKAEACEKALKEAAQAAGASEELLKKAHAETYSAEAEVEVHSDTVIATFEELRARTSPAPEAASTAAVEEPAEDPQASSAAAAGDEAGAAAPAPEAAPAA